MKCSVALYFERSTTDATFLVNQLQKYLARSELLYQAFDELMKYFKSPLHCDLVDIKEGKLTCERERAIQDLYRNAVSKVRVRNGFKNVCRIQMADISSLKPQSSFIHHSFPNYNRGA